MQNEARIKHNSDCKYILAEAKKENEKWLILASWPRDWHAQIADDLRTDLAAEGTTLERILGGGRLAMNKKTKTIQTYGCSGSYGYAPQSLVAQVLREKYPDYKLGTA